MQRRRAREARRRRRIRRCFGVILVLLLILAGYRGSVWFWEWRLTSGLAHQDVLSRDIFNDPEAKESLLRAAGENGKVMEILEHHEEYPDRLLEMLVSTPEALDFIYEYPREKEKEREVALETPADGCVPLFLQWDRRWGYESYGTGMIGLDGCGPTCLSMVYVGLTGDTAMHPGAMAEYSVRSGYVTESAATSWDLMTAGAAGLGLSSRTLSLDEGQIRQELLAGHPIICSMRPGDFTTTGHFIVLTGVEEDGQVCVNDPNSPALSGKKWELQNLMWQMKNLWVFEAGAV